MRYLPEVLRDMVIHIPEDQTKLLVDLNKISEDAKFTAPEAMHPRWIKAWHILSDFMPTKLNDWQQKVVDIFSGKPPPSNPKEMNASTTKE